MKMLHPKQWIAVFLLALIALISLPREAVHACESEPFSTHHTSDAEVPGFHQSDCAICDFQLPAFEDVIPTKPIADQFIPVAYNVSATSLCPNERCCQRPARAPPVAC